MLNKIKKWFFMEGIRFALKQTGEADLMKKALLYIKEVDCIDIDTLKGLLTNLLDDWKGEIQNA